MRWVTDSIESKRLVPGAPVPAERQLADRLHVSRTAVRAALDHLESLGMVEQPGDGRRRRVATLEARSREARAGLLADTVALLSQRPALPEGATLNQAASQQIEAAGHHALLIHPNRLEQRGVESFANAGLKGLLVIDEVDRSELIQQVLEACRDKLPVVVRGYGPASRQYDRVISDHEGGTYELTRRLIERGCRRILRFWRVTDHPAWLDLRDAGYERAMRDAGLQPLPAVRLPEIPVEGESERALQDFARLYAGYLMEHLNGPDPIDGLLVVTDAHAYQVAASLRLLNRVPNADVLIAGFDHTVAQEPWGQWAPAGPLYTVDKNNAAGGRMMLDLLVERAADELPEEPQCRVTPATVVEVSETRESPVAEVNGRKRATME